MSNQVGDCFKFLWPFQNVRTLSDPLFVCFISQFFMLCFMFHFFFTFFSSRASRDEMAASAGATTAFPKSDSQNSGLVGNIHGQDVEASKGGSGGLVYWAEKGVAILWVVPRPSTLPDEPHALLWFVIDLQFKLHTCSLVHLMYSLVKFIYSEKATKFFEISTVDLIVIT